MRIPSYFILIAAVFLAGCGTSANPFNWFGNDAPNSDVLEPIDSDNPLIPERDGIFSSGRNSEQYAGTTIDAITELTIEQVPGGILVRATGLSATQGVYNARLILENEDGLPEDGVLTFQLRAQYKRSGVGAPETREVTVGRRLTDQDISGVRTIRVEGLQNAVERRP